MYIYIKLSERGSTKVTIEWIPYSALHTRFRFDGYPPVNHVLSLIGAKLICVT